MMMALGITARSSYMPAEDCMTMLPLDEDGSGGGAAAEIVQTTLDHFQEPMIAGKTHSEILGMKRRDYWYRKISHAEHEEAMKIVETARRAKISEASLRNWARADYRENWLEKRSGENHHFYGKTLSEEHRKKMSEAHGEQIPWNKGLKTGPLTQEHRNAIAEGNRGSTMNDEDKAKISAAWTPKRIAEQRVIMTGEDNPAKRPEARAKNSAAKTGENHPMWKGGTSFFPYCHLFNEQLKEKIRNRDNRVCVLCGTGEIQNGQRLSVHHINSDKMQGCNGVPWYLCALCRSCNSKPDTIEKEFLIVTGGHGG